MDKLDGSKLVGISCPHATGHKGTSGQRVPKMTEFNDTVLYSTASLRELHYLASDLAYLNSSPLSAMYKSLSLTLDIIASLLDLPNLCESCRLRVKDTWHCDMSSCEIMHRTSCQSYEKLG